MSDERALNDVQVGGFIDTQAQSINTENQGSALLVLDLEGFYAVHLKVLCELQILDHSIFTRHVMVVLIVCDNALEPLLVGLFVLLLAGNEALDWKALRAGLGTILSVLRSTSIRSKEYSCIRWAVDFARHNITLDLN